MTSADDNMATTNCRTESFFFMEWTRDLVPMRRNFAQVKKGKILNDFLDKFLCLTSIVNEFRNPSL